MSGRVRRALGILVGLALVGLTSALEWANPTRPMLRFDESLAFHCGTSPAGSYGRHPWTVENVGDSPVRLRTRFTSGRSGLSLWQDRPTILPPGERIVVHLTWVTPAQPGRPFSSYATIWTNDPTRPIFRFQVVGVSGSTVSP